MANQNTKHIDKEKDAYQLSAAYLKTHVYQGLKNLHDGFDVESIYYFSEANFSTLRDRVEALGIGIAGIEPWLDRQ